MVLFESVKAFTVSLCFSPSCRSFSSQEKHDVDGCEMKPLPLKIIHEEQDEVKKDSEGNIVPVQETIRQDEVRSLGGKISLSV